MQHIGLRRLFCAGLFLGLRCFAGNALGQRLCGLQLWDAHLETRCSLIPLGHCNALKVTSGMRAAPLSVLWRMELGSSVKAADPSWCGHLGSCGSTQCSKVILEELAPHWGGKAGPSPPNIYWWNQEWQGGSQMFLNHSWELSKSCHCSLSFTLGAFS